MTDDEVAEHITTAIQAHQQLDALRMWAVQQEADLLAKAEVADEIDHGNAETLPAASEDMRRAAAKIRTVYERIEQGDNARVRNAGNND